MTFPWDPSDSRPVGAHLAAFHERRGRAVLEAGGAYFVRLGRFSYARVPGTEPLEPDLAALDEALSRARAFGAQYPTLTHPGAEYGGFVCRTAGYSLERIRNRERRWEVRKGLESATIRALAPEELLARGVELNRETLARQRRSDREFGTERGWRRFVAAVQASDPHVLAFGALVDGRLSCYVVVCREGNTLHKLYGMSRTADRRRYASVALDYWLLAEAAKDPTIDVVANGNLRASLQRYKLSIGYQIFPYRWASRLNPRLRKLAAGGWCGRASAAVSRILPRSAYAQSLAAWVRTVQQHA